MLTKEMQARFRRWRRLLSLVVVAALVCPGANAQGDPSDEYLIGPGDTLNVDVWREPDLSLRVPVRPDGRISTPLVEDMIAVGKTPRQLGRDIEEVLSEYVRAPEVTVIVEGFVGTFQSQIRVLGEVGNPGSYPYRDGMMLMDAIIQAGNLTEFAGRRSTLTRTVDGEQVEIRLRVDRLMKDGDIDEDLPLRPGDVIVVRSSAF